MWYLYPHKQTAGLLLRTAEVEAGGSWDLQAAWSPWRAPGQGATHLKKQGGWLQLTD